MPESNSPSPGPRRQVLVAGVEVQAPGDRSSSLGWKSWLAATSSSGIIWAWPLWLADSSICSPMSIPSATRRSLKRFGCYHKLPCPILSAFFAERVGVGWIFGIHYFRKRSKAFWLFHKACMEQPRHRGCCSSIPLSGSGLQASLRLLKENLVPALESAQVTAHRFAGTGRIALLQNLQKRAVLLIGEFRSSRQEQALLDEFLQPASDVLQEFAQNIAPGG